MAFLCNFKINRLLKLNIFPSFCKSYSSQRNKVKCIIETKKNLRTLMQNQSEKNSDKHSDTNLVKNDLNISLGRKFVKSSTQTAIRKPLKIPKLANPFPEPLKTLPSDVVSDEEKAKQMEEQVKMEANYYLQLQQEKLLQDKLEVIGKSQEKINQIPANIRQPTYKKPKDYLELEKESIQMKNNQLLYMLEGNSVNMKRAVHSRRGRRKKLIRNTKHFRNTSNSRQMRSQLRKYSTCINSKTLLPDIMSEIEHCELILEKLKSKYPECGHIQKPLFLSGSPEENQFIKDTYKLIGKLKYENKKKETAPFPSYSEIKTYAESVSFYNSRYYSTKNEKSKPGDRICNKRDKVCPNFKLKGCKPVEKPHCVQMCGEKAKCKKQEAPYPSYSECMDDPNEEEFTECKACPWKINMDDFYKKMNKKKYSTTAANLDTELGKKKEPCKSPFPPTPPCDYEETARKNTERKRDRKNPKPTKKTSDESGQVIRKIKQWLSSYRPENQNIKVSRSEIDEDGRETYVIEVCELEEIPLQTRLFDTRELSHVVEFVEPSPVIAKNIPGFFTLSDKIKGGCPPKEEKEDKKKCRQPKKRKLPSCDNVPKKKNSSAKIYPFQEKVFPNMLHPKKKTDSKKSNKIKPEEIGLLLNQKQTLSSNEQFEPFKLKRQFWRK